MNIVHDQSVESFLGALASKSPTPGGGSAVAVLGAMGAALVSMVANLTIGKKNYEGVEADMFDALHEADRLREQILSLVAADIAAFDQVMAAYGLPKETEAQKQSRSEAIQLGLKAATEVPLVCAKLCREVILLSRSVAEKGNRNVISDAGVAVLSAHAGFRSAVLNVHVNTGTIRDVDFVANALSQLEAVGENLDRLAEETYEIVKSRL
jgi:formiminotetrahydrofolate cyclodeaminase